MNKNNENYKKSKDFWLDEPYKFSSLYKTKNLFLLPNKIFLHKRIEKIKKYIDKNLNFTVLDIGCGSGEFTSILKDYYGKVIGMDVSDKMIEIAKKNYVNRNIIFTKNECTNTQLSDNSIDYIFALGLFDYIENIENVLNEFKRILKHKGKILITIPKNPSIFFVFRWLTGIRYKIFDAPPIVNAVNRSELELFCKSKNLKILDLCSLWTTTWIVYLENNH